MPNLPKPLRKLREQLRGRTDAYAVLGLMGLSFVGMVAANVPARQNFEAEFTVTTLDLETAGSDRFLNAVNDVSSVSVNTDRATTLSFEGRFGAENDTELNEALEALGSTTLEVEIAEGGAWTIALPDDAEPGDGLTVEEIRLDRARLERLRLRGSQTDPALRLEFESAADESAGMLHLIDGAASLQLVLENATLAGLDRPAGEVLELTFAPDSFARQFDLPAAGAMSIDLPETPEDSLGGDAKKKPAPNYCQGCIWGDLETEDVRLAETLKLGDDLAEERVQSAIVAGTVRMAGKSLKMERGQFFLSGRPGIEKVQDIQLDPGSGQLTVRVSGRSKRVAVGIDPERPISTISASRLVAWLGEAGAATALTFCTGWFSAGMMWVVTSLVKKEE